MARSIRNRRLTSITFALCLALASCSGDTGADVKVRLEVRDGWIREPGSGCAGSRPFLYVHQDGDFRVERASGGEVTSGTLPEGQAEEATDIELETERVPTFCVFSFDFSVPEPGDYRLVLEEGSPLEFAVEGEENDVTLLIP